MRYNELDKVNQEFVECFGVHISEFMDKKSAWQANDIAMGFNVIDFDFWLEGKHKDYANEQYSLIDCVEKYYGERARMLITKILK